VSQTKREEHEDKLKKEGDKLFEKVKEKVEKVEKVKKQ
jgi:hypothetical protein